MSVKDIWLRFRSSNAFLYSLLTFLAAWFLARAIWHFDTTNGWLNVLLSIEASVATCMILDLQFRAMRHDQEVMTAMRHLLEEATQREKHIEQILALDE